MSEPLCVAIKYKCSNCGHSEVRATPRPLPAYTLVKQLKERGVACPRCHSKKVSIAPLKKLRRK